MSGTTKATDRTAGLDLYGHARMPGNMLSGEPQRIDRIPYGRFRNVYLYITEACQLRCGHCYMGARLDRALTMPYPDIEETLVTWRQLGGSKLTILGGEPTLHRRYVDVVRLAGHIGYEHVITTTNGLMPARKRFEDLVPADFAYVQISVDGGSAATHDAVRGRGAFEEAVGTVALLCQRGFDVRIICTVNRENDRDCLRLLDIADDLGVSLVKYHVFSVLGRGHGNAEWAMTPPEWIAFYKGLEEVAKGHRTRVWYQPTYAYQVDLPRFRSEGFRGCVGRTLDRISIFPDGRAYVCSYLFDTPYHFAEMRDGKVVLNKEMNEFELFIGVLKSQSCGSCKAPTTCAGGCPAEEIMMGAPSCRVFEDIIPVCRLWKSEVSK